MSFIDGFVSVWATIIGAFSDVSLSPLLRNIGQIVGVLSVFLVIAIVMSFFIVAFEFWSDRRLLSKNEVEENNV